MARAYPSPLDYSCLTSHDPTLSRSAGLGHLVGSMARRLSAPLELSRGQGRGLTKAAWEPSPSCGGFSGGILRDVGQGTGEHGNFSIPLRRFHPKVTEGSWKFLFCLLRSRLLLSPCLPHEEDDMFSSASIHNDPRRSQTPRECPGRDAGDALAGGHGG